MNADAFYQTMAAFCFTLVGLWWAVVQFRHEEWMADPAWRRLVHSVHFSFLVPGVMSLAAIIAGDIKLIWRLAFILSCAFAIIALLYLTSKARAASGGKGKAYRGWFIDEGRWVTILLYALIAVVAANTDLVKFIGLDIKPLQIEGLLLTLLVFLGASVAWDFLAESKA
jgi:hypothetical protein